MLTTIRRSGAAASAAALTVGLALSLAGNASAQVPTAAPVKAAAVAVAPTLAPAYTTAHLKVICSAVNIRANHTTSSTILGVGYRGDADAVTIGYLPKGSDAYTWLYGTVTRADGKRVTGWAIATCVH